MPLVAHNNLPTFERLRQEGCSIIGLEESKKRQVPRLRIGLLNLMPDAALQATERQFMRLLGATTGSVDIYVYVFSVAAMPRIGRALEHVNGYYEDFESVKHNGLDALVLTGANPAQAQLSSEPFWNGMVEVIEWGRNNVCSTLCSCLATHAVVKQYHQVDRRLLPQKRWGVYSHRVSQHDHFMTYDITTRFDAPHSHVYEVTELQLESVGLTVLAVSEEAGVHLAVSADQLQFVYFQGHPEYDYNSLFKEFKREVSRFASGEREDYPPFPENYFNPEAIEILTDYRKALYAARDRVKMLDTFPERLVEPMLDNTWTDTGKAMFNNWLSKVLQV